MIAFLNDLIWGKILIFTLIPIGVMFTLWSRGVQFRHFFNMFSVLGEGFQHRTAQPSSFQALALSVAGRVGGGNIAGVAAAIAIGGPGAIFWMWIVGLAGMATSFFECTLAQVYKQKEPDGNFRGGPAYYIEKGLGRMLGGGTKYLGYVYSLLLLATFGVAFVTFQSFAMSSSIEGAFGLERMWSGIGLALLVGFVILGGIRRIASVVEYVVPVMAVGYAAIVIVVIALRIDDVPGVLATIVTSAFGPEEAIGGGVGAVILQGVQRGLFSNEAGLGSAPNVAAVAYVEHPAQQGLVQSLSVFIDTILLCTCTALIILLSGIDFVGAKDGELLTQLALADHIGGWAEYFIAGALFLFAFSSIMYSYYLGETAIDYYWQDSQAAFMTYRAVVVGFVVFGAMRDLGDVLAYSNVTMGLLAIVNLFAVALLLPVGMRVMRDFDSQRKAGVKVPKFDIGKFSDLDLDRAAWPTGEDMPPPATEPR